MAVSRRRDFLTWGAVVGASVVSGCRSKSNTQLDESASNERRRTTPAKTPEKPSGKAAPKVAVRQLPELDKLLEDLRSREDLPALAAAIVCGGDVAWANGYGFADRAKKIPASADSVFYSASIGKTVTAVALMQHWENGLFALDDDISTHLPMKVRNPNFPSDKITFRHLLTHTSSLIDTAAVDDVAGPGDSNITMDEFMKGYLVEGGAYWSESNFGERAPGKKYAYSNSGATLLGYLAERIGKKPFDQQCDERIFRPLGMPATSWRLSGLPKDAVIALGYGGSRGKRTPLPRLGQDPAYPSGALQTTVRDMGRFLAAFMQKGLLSKARILQEKTVAEMLEIQPSPAGDEGYGLIWYRADWGKDKLIGHSGSYDGFNTEMWYDPHSMVGALFFVNADKLPEAASETLMVELTKQGRALG